MIFFLKVEIGRLRSAAQCDIDDDGLVWPVRFLHGFRMIVPMHMGEVA